VPEGDTIHKIAGFMAPRLEGRVLERVAMADRAAAGKATGRVVEDVFARGKHLFVTLDDSSALRSHLGMYGSWHVYGPDLVADRIDADAPGPASPRHLLVPRLSGSVIGKQDRGSGCQAFTACYKARRLSAFRRVSMSGL